jgi:hypothetical protein
VALTFPRDGVDEAERDRLVAAVSRAAATLSARIGGVH